MGNLYTRLLGERCPLDPPNLRGDRFRWGAAAPRALLHLARRSLALARCFAPRWVGDGTNYNYLYWDRLGHLHIYIYISGYLIKGHSGRVALEPQNTLKILMDLCKQWDCRFVVVHEHTHITNCTIPTRDRQTQNTHSTIKTHIARTRMCACPHASGRWCDRGACGEEQGGDGGGHRRCRP